MKKIILGLILLSSISYADKGYVVTTTCVDGYKFVVVDDAYAIAVVQMFEISWTDFSPQPIKCKGGK